MFGQPGKQLLFMGAETGTYREWDHESTLEWELLDNPDNAGIARWITDCNRLHRTEAALHAWDCDERGYEWIVGDDAANSVFAWLRLGPGARPVAVVANATPVPRYNYRLGVPRDGIWSELANSDAEIYGGSGMGNFGRVEAAPLRSHGRPSSLVLTLPPLSVLFLAWDEPAPAAR